MPFCSTALIDSCTSCVLVEQLVGLLADQRLVGFLHGEPARLGAPAAHLAEDVADRDRAHLRARHAGDLEHRKSAAGLLHLDLDFLVVHLAVAQLAAERLLGGGARGRAGQRIDHAILGGEMRLRLDVLALALAHLRDRDLDQVAHDLLDVAADVADLGELGRLDLEERRAGKPRQAARNLGLADAGRADHQDVLRQHFLAQPLVELHAAPAIAQRDRDRALGVALPDDEAVELGNDLAGREVGHASRTIRSAMPSGVSTSRSRDKSGFFVGADRARIRRIGIGHDARRAGCEQAFDEGADEAGAVAATDHVGLADHLVDAARRLRLRAEADVPVGQAIALQVAERRAPNETMYWSMAGSLRSPLTRPNCSSGSPHHSRTCGTREPVAHQRQVGGRHRAKLVLRRHAQASSTSRS